MYLWGSHMEGLEDFTHNFNKSIDFDYILYKEDITGSLAHVKMLRKINILNEIEYEKISNTLKDIYKEIESKCLLIDKNEEDIHSFIEIELTKRIGDLGKKLHTARSRNDQCAVDLRLYSKKSLFEIKNSILELLNISIKIAENNLETIMPGYTHMQHAQVITFSHYILAYSQMFLRDLKRLMSSFDRLDENPLGACALATTSFPIDREYTTSLLGFKKPTENSLDSVSDRDYVLEILFNNSLIMMHLSRLSEELIYFSTTEFNYIKFHEKYSTGSSIMPQKKNPDMAELVRGKSGRVYGDLFSLLTVLKSTPLSYNKDFQEDKEPLFDSINTTLNSVKIMSKILSTLRINKDEMKKSAKEGYLTATDLCDYLVYKKVPFRSAYDIAGAVVNYALSKNLKLEEIELTKYKEFSETFEDDLYDFIKLENSLKNRNVYGGPAPEVVKIQINNLKEELKNLKSK